MKSRWSWLRWASSLVSGLDRVVSAATSTLSVANGTVDESAVDVRALTATVKNAAGTALPSKAVTYSLSACAVSASLSEVFASPAEIADDGVESATLTVIVRDASGNAIPNIAASRVVFASTGSGNTVTQPGAVTTVGGIATGSLVSTGAATKTISCTVDGVAITDTASVVVSGTPAGDTYNNEPVGFVSIAEWNNEASLIPAGREWYDEANPSPYNGGIHERVTSGYTGTPPIGGSAVVHWHIDQGEIGGGGAGRLIADVSGDTPQEMFIGWTHQFPSDFPTSDNEGGNKMLFVLFSGVSTPRTYLVYDSLHHSGNWAMALEDFTFTESNVASAGPVFGDWAKIEWYMNYGTGAADGIVRLWQDDVLILEMTAVTFPTGSHATQFYDEGTNNGVHYPNPGDPRVIAPVAYERYTSHLYFSVPA